MSERFIEKKIENLNTIKKICIEEYPFIGEYSDPGLQIVLHSTSKQLKKLLDGADEPINIKFLLDTTAKIIYMFHKTINHNEFSLSIGLGTIGQNKLPIGEINYFYGTKQKDLIEFRTDYMLEVDITKEAIKTEIWNALNQIKTLL